MHEITLETLRFVIATEAGAEVVEGFTLPKSPLAIHVDPARGWILTLRDGGLAVLKDMTEKQAHYALRVLSPLAWVEPYDAEGQRVHHLQSSFSIERTRGQVKYADVVRHFIRRLRDDERLYSICGPPTEMWELVVGAVAATEGCCHADAEERLKSHIGRQRKPEASP